jgi:hypothetical protein
MDRYLINQLHFITNTEMVLKYIRAGRVHDNPPPEFSLNAIKSMPDELFLPLDDAIVSLSESNVDFPDMGEPVKKAALSEGPFGLVGKLSESGIAEKIETVRKNAPDSKGIELIERAVANYRQFGFFSQYDWRLVHWGTLADIHSVTPDTFEPPTSYLEFTTLWTPPIAAMQELANTFPSVRFKFKYRYRPEDPWIVEDIFAFPPFGY